jgi:hypothetical protein
VAATLLIATDEAGYGPKLGPLVVAATVWEIDAPLHEMPDDATLENLFAPLRNPVRYESLNLQIADSKAIFQPARGLRALHAVISAAIHWCGHDCQTLDAWLPIIAANDLDSLQQSPWLRKFDDQAFEPPELTAGLLNQWRHSGLQLTDIQTRVITATHFNQSCVDDRNKADLLSETTIGLIRSAIELPATECAQICVFCDRHGGRRYYGGVLQHFFPQATLQVMAETKTQSRYRLRQSDRTIEIAFTVKGDSFTPVSLSSMIAKYVRERLMESFNGYFAARHQGAEPLKPTAGYPLDAERFLQDIEPIIATERIRRCDLVRLR